MLSVRCLAVSLSSVSVCDVGVLWPNGGMDQDETWQGGTQHCEICTAPHPNSGPCLLWPYGWLDQVATCYEGRPRPRRHCVRWGPSSPRQRGTAPNFRPMSIVAKRSPISATAEHLYIHSIMHTLVQRSICVTNLKSLASSVPKR